MSATALPGEGSQPLPRSAFRTGLLLIAALALLVAIEASVLFLLRALGPLTTLILAVPAALGAVLAFRAAELERRRSRATAEALARTKREADRREEEAERRAAEWTRAELTPTIQDLRTALDQERDRASTLEETRDVQSRWLDELRNQVFERESRGGALADTEDVPALVLRIAMALLEARKGLLLLSRDGDQRLRVGAWEGFDHDPTDSAIAERFGTEVVEKGRVVREEDGPKIDASARTPADEEIENLVAIPIYILDQFMGVVVCANGEGGFSEHDEEVLLSLGGHAGVFLRNAKLRGEVRNAYLSTVHVLADAMEAKDGSLRGHCDEVAQYASSVADRLGLEPDRRERIVFASLLHDVGKIGITERILLKPAPLTVEEFNVVKLHPRIGYRLLQQVPALDAIAPAILHHHERFDGQGYPSGLKGEEIPIDARIICIADCFSAMTSDRPYRPAMPLERACEELQQGAGRHFDPEIVKLFIDEVNRRPPRQDRAGSFASALDDPELEARRLPEEVVLGQHAVTLVDNVTMLYSHRYFQEAVATESQRASVQGSPFAVVLVELEGLGRINREDGFATGDSALQGAAAVLLDIAAEADGVAARFGGSMLALLLPRAGEEEADRLAGGVAGRIDGKLHARTAVATWRPGDAPAAVVDRALRRVRTGDLTSHCS